MHLEMLGQKVAERVVFLLHQKIGRACHACIVSESNLCDKRSACFFLSPGPTGKRRLGYLFLAIAEDKELEPGRRLLATAARHEKASQKSPDLAGTLL